MPRSSLSVRALLIGGNVSLVLAAVLGVVVAGTGLLKRLADEQAIARVSLAGASALRIVDRTREQLQTGARLLAEEPTLGRLVAAGDTQGLAAFLERFRSTGGLTGCAVVENGRILASAGSEVPWDEIVSGTGPDPGPFLVVPKREGPMLLGASSSGSGVSGARVVVALALDEAFSAWVAGQIGLPVQILDRERALAPEGPGHATRLAARSRALDSEAAVAERLTDAELFVSVQILSSEKGEIAGLIETSLPSTGVASSLRRFVRRLLLFSALVAGLAGLFSVLLGRRLVTPLEELTEASSRIGRGDLATPISKGYSAEIGTLAESMDEMRGRLLELTTELRRRQAEAEAVLTGIVEGVFAVDRERRIRYANPQTAELLGRTPEEIVGRFCGDVLNPRDARGIRPCEDRCPIIHARFRGSTRATEHLVLPGGVERTVLITSASPEVGDPVAASGAGAASGAMQFQVIRDETELEATRRSRDSVLANISHEFRTPLSAQLASIELLRERLQEIEPQEVRELVLSLERGTLRLTQLIDNLLESVRIESGLDSIRRRPVALDEVVEEAVDLTTPLATLREQTIRVDLPYPLPGVSGDAPRLVQVFVNLLANANKFAPVKSAIRVGGEVGEHEVKLWVEDEGPGLPSRTAEPRFERFRRSPGEEPAESGMGLGLFIVKSIVERHGGRIEVEGRGASAGAPTGTRMCVVLPIG